MREKSLLKLNKTRVCNLTDGPYEVIDNPEMPNGKEYVKAKGGPKYESGETRHHAEQRAVNNLKKNEEFAGLCPTKGCCDKCRSVLEGEGYMDKVPDNYQFMDKKVQKEFIKNKV